MRRSLMHWVSVFALFFVHAAGFALHDDALTWFPERLMRFVVDGRYGLDALFTARTETLAIETTLTDGMHAHVWRDVPHVGGWATATLMWIVTGAALLAAAAMRHRERRSPHGMH